MRLLARATPAFWLLLTTALVGAAFLGATLYSNHLAGGIDRMAEDIAGNAVPSIRYLDDARTQLHAMVVLVRDGLSDTARARVDDRAVEAHRRRLQDDLDAYVALPWFPGERERWL